MLTVAALALAGCAGQRVDYSQSALSPAGPVARLQLQLIEKSLYVMTFVFLVVMLMLAYVLIRYRARRGEDGEGVQVHGNAYLELTWTIIPILLLAYLAVPTVRAVFHLNDIPDKGPIMHVDVIGHQFWWEFRYTDPDLGIVTANELHVPVGTTVAFRVTSADVIHSFWAPRLGGKVDAIPGRENRLWLRADKPGVYTGACAQLCGDSHAYMDFSVIAETKDKFDAWVAEMKKPFTAPTDAEAQAGMQVFAKSCQSCHAIAGTQFKGAIGPNLTGLMLRQTIAALTLENNHDNLIRWVSDASAVKPGVKMPTALKSTGKPGNLGLSEDQVKAVVAFLETLK